VYSGIDKENKEYGRSTFKRFEYGGEKRKIVHAGKIEEE
jgi:hypothetical protein